MMSLERMDAAGGKVRRAQLMVSLIEAGAHQLSREQILESVGLLREELQGASEAIEEAYQARQQKPGQAPAGEIGPPRAPVTALELHRRPS